ncbi:MAG TPA: transposase, partial [Candidatus Korarchaeota archaeon]|nr:transposase [Candidatus Korarchaeota archaeon]
MSKIGRPIVKVNQQTERYIKYNKYTTYNWYKPSGWDEHPDGRRSGSMGTKPLILVIGHIEKDFDIDGVVNLKSLLVEKKGEGKKEEKKLERRVDDCNEVCISFVNPSQLNPTETSKFCAIPNLSKEAGFVLSAYRDIKKHFAYPVEAMLRLLFYQRLARIKHYTTLEAKLKQNSIAKNLGFEEVPKRRTINRFVNERLGNENLRRIQKSFIERLKRKLTEERIKLGRGISIDSTPLPTLKNDECGKYNAYYFQKYNIGKMVKVHFATCVDT